MGYVGHFVAELRNINAIANVHSWRHWRNDPKTDMNYNLHSSPYRAGIAISVSLV